MTATLEWFDQDGTACSAPVDDVLAEPEETDPAWILSVVRRLLTANGVVRPADAGNPAHQRYGAGSPDLPECAWGFTGVGSGAPTLVLVGDRSPQRHVPFHSPSGAWLWRALRSLGHDELTCRVVDAHVHDGQTGPDGYRPLTAAEWSAMRRAWTGAVWVLFGSRVQVAARAVGVVGVRVPHPVWGQRWRRDEPADYARRLEEEGVPRGPWQDGLPVVRRAELPELPGDAGQLPVIAHDLPAKLPRGAPSGPKAPVAKSKARQARDLYVAGVSPTVADAAREVGADVDGLRVIARRDGWNGRRERLSRSQRVASEAGLAAGEAAADVLRRGFDDLLVRVKAARGDAAALAELATLRAAGDADAEPWHPTPAALEKVARVMLSLRGLAIEQDDVDLVGLLERDPNELVRHLLGE